MVVVFVVLVVLKVVVEVVVVDLKNLRRPPAGQGGQRPSAGAKSRRVLTSSLLKVLYIKFRSAP
jgi:hypothetical protein